MSTVEFKQVVGHGVEQNPVTQRRDRLADIDVGKGIAIFLVVLGHLVARDIKPAGNDWYLQAQVGLYSFHMAFFFYLAGYVFWTAAPAERPRRLRSAATRMLPAYLLMALLGFAAKTLLSGLMPVDRPVVATLESWLTLLMYPTQGFLAFLWFIVVLLTLYVLTLGLLWLLRGMPRPLWWITAAAVAMQLASTHDQVTSLGALHYAMVNWLFFVLGYWSLTWRDRVNPVLRRFWPVLLLALAGALVAVSGPWQWTLPALLAIPALHGLSLQIGASLPALARALTWLGERSWPIYLFNTFAIGAVKVVVLKTVGWDDLRFLFVMPLLLAAGLLLPILLQRGLLKRVKWLDRITR